MTTAHAQSSNFGVPNLMRYDNKLFHFGFLLGYNQFDFSIRSKADLSEYDSLMVVNTAAMSGFSHPAHGTHQIASTGGD